MSAERWPLIQWRSLWTTQPLNAFAADYLFTHLLCSFEQTARIWLCLFLLFWDYTMVASFEIVRLFGFKLWIWTNSVSPSRGNESCNKYLQKNDRYWRTIKLCFIRIMVPVSLVPYWTKSANGFSRFYIYL